MKEDFLHFLWRRKLMYAHNLTTISKEKLKIIRYGTWNKNSGPDFLNAHIFFNDQLWVGNIEMHLKSSDWYVHQHELDQNYDAVILHVVWEHDVDVFMKNQNPLPTLVLKDFINPDVLINYKKLMLKQKNWIFCDKQLLGLNDFLLKNWFERLYIERLERKTKEIDKLLHTMNHDYEAVLFYMLAKTFGSKVNGEAFLKLAQSFPYAILRKLRFYETQLSALLFGQAGFLEDDLEGIYFMNLKKEYAYIKHKFQLRSLDKQEFQFFRMRPANFPTIRVAQLAALVVRYPDLFSRVIKAKEPSLFYKIFATEVGEFWKEHYTFESQSKRSAKVVTKSFIDLIIINVIIPIKFVFMKNSGNVNIESLLEMIRQVNSEKNSIISKFSDIDLVAKNALDSQALIELKSSYCDQSKCLNCAIGSHLLSK